MWPPSAPSLAVIFIRMASLFIVTVSSFHPLQPSAGQSRCPISRCAVDVDVALAFLSPARTSTWQTDCCWLTPEKWVQ
jgi:hypothetical protein